MTDQYELTTKFSARPQQFAWLLGAGTSAAAGLPTATDVIWELKRRYFNREENQEVARQDIQISAVRSRIQDYMLSKGFPREGDPEEYTRYFELIFGDDKERQRQYINARLSEKDVKLSVGNRVLAAMMASGVARAIFTTNFDSVVEKAFAEVSGGSLSAYHLEGAANANRALSNEEYPFYCKLHGDFRYDSLKNLPADLAVQNADLGKALRGAANRFGFIVAGYSGRDESIMDLLRGVLTTDNPFPHGLFWTGRKGAQVLPSVHGLINEATNAGVDAAYVEVDTYDAFMLRLWRNLEGKAPALDAKVRKTYQGVVNIPLPDAGSGAIIRTNALPIVELPKECQSVSFAKSKEWEELKTASRAAEGGLIFTKTDTVLCWGSIEILNGSFSDINAVVAYDLSSRLSDLENNLQVKGFIEDAMAHALVRGRPLLARSGRTGSTIIVDRNNSEISSLTSLHAAVGKSWGLISGLMTEVEEKYPTPEKIYWAEAARIGIEIISDRAWLLIDPDIWIWPPRAKRLATSFLDDRRGNRFNAVYNQLIDAWLDILKGDFDSADELMLSAFDEGSAAENPSFRLGLRSGYSKGRT